MSVTKLRVGAEAYQLTGVAQSLDDYYSGSGEAAGWWAGHGAERLGLEGEVVGDDLRALLAGLRPGGGGLSPNGEAIHPHPRRVPGFDLTFKTPKSVSVLYAVTDDPRVQGAIIDASEAALRDTLAWLERDVMAVRRGTGNERFLADLAATDPAAAAAARIRTESGGEIAAAVFRHRTSRAGDPLLHWHVLIPNLVRGDDDRWSAFVHPQLFRNAKAAGEMYQAALRHELTARLGVQWRPGRHVPEIDGVPQAACDGFSKRSREVETWLDATGRVANRANRQEAVLATRRGKAELEGERFDARWKTEGATYGFGPEHAEALICGQETAPTPTDHEFWRLPEVSVDADGTPYAHDRTVTAEEWIADLLRRDLCVADATFTRPQMFGAVARRLGDGAAVPTIERIAARVMASPQVLPIDSSGDRQGIPRWTSTEMVAIERRLLGTFAERGTRTPVAPDTIAATLAAHGDLGPDQAQAVKVLASSPDPVSVMVGPAGTGKTYTLNVAREAFEAAGLQVIGAAPSARAAAELEAGAGVESFTLHALTRRWSDPHRGPGPTTVLIIDEAAMAATRDLEPLVTQTVRAGGRVVLVGDHRQLPEVTAGGGLAAAIDTVGSVAELTVNRRQRDEWEREALTELRNGSVPAAVDAYRAHGRVTVVGEGESVIAIAADRYLTAVDHGLQPILMAGTNDTVHRLNWAVRTRLIERGAIPGPASGRGDGDLGGRFAVGERVVLRRNQRIAQPGSGAVAVRNSDAARVLDVGDDGALTVRREADQAVIRLDAGYVGAGHVDFGYAVTAHRAQGGTWDMAIAVGADGLYREAAYVQMSRGRLANELIIPAPQMDDIDRELVRHDHGLPLPGEEPPEAIDDLVDRMEKSRAKLMALSRDPDADRIATLARTTSLPDLDRRAHECRVAERAATRHIGIDPKVLTQGVERAQRTALHVEVGQQVKAYDRQNIGVVVGFDDVAGTVDVHFRSHRGHEATRTLPWTELDIVETALAATRVLPPVARERLDRLVQSCDEALGAWHDHLGGTGVANNEARRCDRARELVIDRTAALLAARNPEWLTGLLGPRSAGPHDASIWDHAVRVIAEQRAATQLPETEPGIGTEPTDPNARRRWQRTSRHVLEARTHLDNAGTHRDLGPWPLLPSRSQLDKRLAQLDELLASAPPDQRDLMARLRSGDQLTLVDTTDALNAALGTQGQRRDWILANWPHVVAYAEITRAIDTRTYGPELEDLHTSIRRSSDCLPLLDAVENGEAWVDRALCRLVGRTATTTSPAALEMLEQLATYRQRWDVCTGHPLGGVPRTLDQQVDFNDLAASLQQGWGGPDLPEPFENAVGKAPEGRLSPAVEGRPEHVEVDLGIGL